MTVYFDHTVMMALRLGVWGSPRQPRTFEAEIAARQSQIAAQRPCSGQDGAENREVAEQDQSQLHHRLKRPQRRAVCKGARS